MLFPEVSYLRWAKTHPRARIDLARSGVQPCPPSALGLAARDLVVSLPVRDGYAPLRDAIARRYGVASDEVFTVSGGTSFANWFACAAPLDGCRRGSEVIVERPTYEPLLRIPEALGCRIRRLDRRHDERWAIDLERFASLVTQRTRLAIVSNLHNPSGARIDPATLGRMASILARVGAHLVVDEVYLECEWGRRTASCVHTGPNVLTTNSLTKAYGLDGLRAGWVLGPREMIRRAWLIQDLLANNGVAPGERLSLAAFKRLPEIRRRVHATLDPNLDRLRRFFEREPRLEAFVPDGGNVAFPKLPRGVDGDRLADRLLTRYSTLVVPGRFFEMPRHIRISFGCAPDRLEQGLRNISRALTDLEPTRR
jgi:aspartate/methionine/tyrosine aminotransferase